MTVRNTMAMVVATIGLMTGPVLAGAATAAPAADRTAYTAQAREAGLSAGQADRLQRQVDSYLAKVPGSSQVSANRIRMKGGDLTVAAPGQRVARDLAAPVSDRAASDRAASNRAAAACAEGHLCLYNGSAVLDYYYCGTYDLPNWVGNGTFNNNQSSGTVAKFLNRDRSVRWTSTAKASGTATWDPIWYVVPC